MVAALSHLLTLYHEPLPVLLGVVGAKLGHQLFVEFRLFSFGGFDVVEDFVFVHPLSSVTSIPPLAWRGSCCIPLTS